MLHRESCKATELLAIDAVVRSYAAYTSMSHETLVSGANGLECSVFIAPQSE